jgi:alpha-L-fucosidase
MFFALVQFCVSAADVPAVRERPAPGPALRARIAARCDLIGIVHWGLNTYTDREWGFGDEAPAMLNPSRFNADQIVGACRDGGLQGLVVVAKHHDGFCLWPTKTTTHNISRSPFRGGKGDYVREMSDACRRAGLKFGVYVSPWDRNNVHYGTEKYVEIYHAQIKELLSGAYGEVTKGKRVNITKAKTNGLCEAGWYVADENGVLTRE